MAERFEFGGGKALPEEMTGPVMPIPSEARWKASEERRIAGVRRRRKGLPEDGKSEVGGAARATTMFDQVMAAIDFDLCTNSFFAVCNTTPSSICGTKQQTHSGRSGSWRIPGVYFSGAKTEARFSPPGMLPTANASYGLYMYWALSMCKKRAQIVSVFRLFTCF